MAVSSTGPANFLPRPKITRVTSRDVNGDAATACVKGAYIGPRSSREHEYGTVEFFRLMRFFIRWSIEFDVLNRRLETVRGDNEQRNDHIEEKTLSNAFYISNFLDSFFIRYIFLMRI